MFREKYFATTLEEVKIVLYSKDMGLDMFFQLDNSQRVNSENAAIKEQQNELPPKSMNWIQFMNYSYTADNLSLAIKTLGEQLKHPILFSVKIPLEEFEDVFFFNDLLSMIPDITGNGLLVKVYQGDILNVDVDGIVNAANKWLAHGGGVARAIIKAAGDAVNKEGQRKLNECGFTCIKLCNIWSTNGNLYTRLLRWHSDI
ncbi:MACROD [Acanthosepion pharaonis]|uniref:MACROD n=1 Tax=Acanthosepion pharaonis TaxID=158019 RepID=A0A812CSJ1_ACAPH|nr:MACROD [Sepia pharaonis]